MKSLFFLVLLVVCLGVNAAPVTVDGYTFDDSAENVFQGIIVEYDNEYPNGVGPGALDRIMSGGDVLFDIDLNNPENVDANVDGFLTSSNEEIATPASVAFNVYDENDSFVGKLLEGTLSHATGNQYNFTVTGGDASGYFTSGIFEYDSTIVGGDFADEAFTLTMTASPVPLPAAGWLFGSGLLGLIGVARRKQAD